MMNRKNSFDFIRLFAASLVVFSHSFALTGHAEPTIGGGTLGGLGVWIFFIISGYFIASSWDQYPRFNIFMAKRILRIFPGLAVALILTIIICGLFYTSLPFFNYITDQGTLTYLNNIFLYNGVMALPGVFTTNIYPIAVNGSIWTLPYEFTMYLVVALFGVFKINKHLSYLKIWIIIFSLVFILNIVGYDYLKFNIFYLTVNQLLPLSLMFFSGIVFYKERSKIKLDTKYGIVGLIAFIAFSTLIPAMTSVFAATLLAYALFAIGRNPRMSWIGKYGDFSYGIYIYSFPIQQMIVASTGSQNAWKVFFASFTLSVIIGAASWHIVESRALRYKTKINTKKYPLRQVDDIW